jgi:hypothetical protein
MRMFGAWLEQRLKNRGLWHVQFLGLVETCPRWCNLVTESPMSKRPGKTVAKIQDQRQNYPIEESTQVS